eukprot:Sspe_Gene.95355::Locus_67655_Transcript_1_1_Confidence_1.000_Length_1022::g.95355::m.95355
MYVAAIEGCTSYAAAACFAEQREREGHPVTLPLVNALIKACIPNGEVDEAEGVLRMAHSQRIRTSKKTAHRLVVLFTQRSDLEGLERTLRSFEGRITQYTYYIVLRACSKLLPRARELSWTVFEAVVRDGLVHKGHCELMLTICRVLEDTKGADKVKGIMVQHRMPLPADDKS